MTTTPQSNSKPKEPRLLPCPLLGHLPDKGEFTNGPYLAVSGAPDMPKFYAVVCPGCCSTAYDENKERVIKKWNSRVSASTAPVVDEEAIAKRFDYAAWKGFNQSESQFEKGYKHAMGVAARVVREAAAASPEVQVSPEEQDSDDKEFQRLRKEFELSGLGDRPQSMSAAKLRRLIQLERLDAIIRAAATPVQASVSTEGEVKPWLDEGGHPWEIRRNVTCVECPHCCFVFAAEHTSQRFEIDQWEGYDCPNCEGCPDGPYYCSPCRAIGRYD